MLRSNAQECRVKQTMPTKFSSYILPRLQDILFFCVFSLVIILGQHMLNADGDLPRHLAAGRLIFQSHSIPNTEPFMYPYADRAYISHEWLSDIIFYLIDNYFGLAGIVLLSATLLAMAYTLLYAFLSSQVKYRIPIIVIVIWGIIATIPNWITRPYLFSILLLVIWLIAADRLARGQAVSLWYLPALMILWSNLHGEFIAGILVLIAYAVGWTWDYLRSPDTMKPEIGKKLWVVLILSCLASFFRPGSGQSWIIILSFLNNRYLTSLIIEAQSPNFQQPTFFLMFGLLIYSIFLLAIKRERISTGHALLLAGFSAMALVAARNIHLYTVVVPFVLAKPLTTSSENKYLIGVENILRNIEENLKGILWPLITVILFCVFILNTGDARNYQFDRNSFPVDAVEWLKSHPQEGNVFNDINWGGYIAFQTWPRQSIFIDSIGDYSGDATKEYISVMSLSDTWYEVFLKYNIRWAIISPQSLLAKTLMNNLHWKLIYKDNTAVILTR